jgi:Leucine-rich repeat (LRR) protein
MKRLLTLLLSLALSGVSLAQNTLLDSVSLALYNEYTDLKEALKQPDQVLKLSLRKQGLKEFPKEVLQLKNLQYLDLSKNKIESLPDSIIQLKQLQVLIVSKNELVALPNTIGGLSNLRYFKAGQNKIARIPFSFGSLENLEYLDFWDNELDYFPESLNKLTNLAVMDLRNILISQENQNYIQGLLPNTKIHFSPACQCAW